MNNPNNVHKKEFYKDKGNHDTFKDDRREAFKARNSFTDSMYYRICKVTIKLYKQALETGKDIHGNDLSSEELEAVKFSHDSNISELEKAEKIYYEKLNEEQS
jgi:hypothetical protein